MQAFIWKISGVVIAFVLFTAQTTSLTAHAASFNCDNVQSKVEKMICDNPELSKLDENLGKGFREAMSKMSSKHKVTLINEQKLWLKHKRNLCEDLICLKEVYSTRLTELNTVNSSNSDVKNKLINLEEDLCKSIEKILTKEDTINKARKATNSRELTKNEFTALHTSNLEFFDLPSDYDSGFEVIDIDNDNKQEVFAYIISGSGRIATMAAFDLPIDNKSKPINQLFSAFAGVLQEPYFIQYGGKNYLITAGELNSFQDITVSEITKRDKSFIQVLSCVAKTEIAKKQLCNQPACKALVSRIAKNTGNEFTEEIWPHKYLPPFGLKVFTYGNPISIDYDNSGITRYIWKLGRKDYFYENIYWSWIGEGSKEIAPTVSRPESDTNEPRNVIPGDKQDNLRKVIKQHESLLRTEKILKAIDKLPMDGEFFFLRHAGLNYWVWSTGDEAAYGETLHIILTQAGKSVYIGSIVTKQLESLIPCKNKCVRKLENNSM